MDTESAISIRTQGWITSNAEKLKESHPDDVIHAWEVGVVKGLGLKDKIIADYFNDKVNKSLAAATELFNILNDGVKMKCSRAFFRINDLKDFDFLYFVDFDAYLSDKLKNAYQEALLVKKRCKKDSDFGFNFILKPFTDNTNIENVFADGYILSYAPESRTTQS